MDKTGNIEIPAVMVYVIVRQKFLSLFFFFFLFYSLFTFQENSITLNMYSIKGSFLLVGKIGES